MEVYELARLNPLSFERLVRALCFARLGPAGTVFSSGPDGGRDFVYEGEIPGYQGKRWDGYLVIQAKFRDGAKGGQDDVRWLTKQLKYEMKKFEGVNAGLRKPEYYIIATNVRLSGSDGPSPKQHIGGHSKISTELASWKSKIGLKDFDIWSADKIVDLLVSYPDVRRTYAAWVTAGDVLSEVLGNLESKRPNFGAIVRRALKSSLRRDQYVRIKDAGSVTDLQIRTSQVFVDLPVERTAYRSDESFPLIASLVDRAREKLDPESVADRDGHLDPRRNKIVLLGGPGQGKSTAALFLSQLFRASAIEADPATILDENIRDLVPEILDRAKTENIQLAIPRRYPVHVALPKFADAITVAKAELRHAPTLLGYMADELARSADDEIDRNDLRRWLKLYPWVIVLDGLDEVPGSGERAAVLDAISSLLTEITEARADTLILVTTRPQGYNRDLNPQIWEHWRLTDLPSERAIAYASALALAHYPFDIDRRTELAERMKDAVSKPATSRLMVSPLQVTIMHMIVDTGGSVPTARWTLFNDYFEILKKREKSKGGATQRILERNLSYLGPIHQRVGLVLQTISERAGSAEGALTHERFRRLLQHYLLSEGFSSGSLDERVSELMEVALNRLVLLSTREEGRISFDVRSLQEYMAAAALTSGDQSTVEARLLHIAGKAHWQHVFLIAASRCFADDGYHHRRSAVVGIPRQLETNESDLLARNGARLALSMFTDGIGIDHPIFRRQLATHALEMLALGANLFEEQLSILWEVETCVLVASALQAHINGEYRPTTKAAWHLLFRIAEKGNLEAISMIEEFWPADEIALRVISGVCLPVPNSRIVDKIVGTLSRARPGKAITVARGFFDRLATEKPEQATAYELSLRKLNVTYNSNKQSVAILPMGNAKPLSSNIVLTQHSELNLQLDRTKKNNGWLPLELSAEFQDSPSCKSLATVLRTIANANLLEDSQELLGAYPWPIAALLHIAEDEKHLMALADSGEDGNFGRPSDWKRAERRWTEKGVDIADLRVAKSGSWFESSVATVGAPPLLTMSVRADRTSFNIASQLADIARQVKNSNIRSKLLELSDFALYGVAHPDFYNSSMTDTILKLKEKTTVKYLSLSPLEYAKDIWESPDLIDRLDAVLTKVDYHDLDSQIDVEKALSAYIADDRRRNLLYLVAIGLVSSSDTSANLLRRMPISAFSEKPDDIPLVKSSIGVLKLLSSNWTTDEVEHLAATFLNEGEPFCGFELLLAAEATPDLPNMEVFLAVLLKRFKGSDQWRYYLRSALCRWLDARRTHLLDRETFLDKLHLPADAYNAVQRVGY